MFDYVSDCQAKRTICYYHLNQWFTPNFGHTIEVHAIYIPKKTSYGGPGNVDLVKGSYDPQFTEIHDVLATEMSLHWQNSLSTPQAWIYTGDSQKLSFGSICLSVYHYKPYVKPSGCKFVVNSFNFMAIVGAFPLLFSDLLSTNTIQSRCPNITCWLPIKWNHEQPSLLFTNTLGCMKKRCTWFPFWGPT